jgi:hypothetical protein
VKYFPNKYGRFISVIFGLYSIWTSSFFTFFDSYDYETRLFLSKLTFTKTVIYRRDAVMAHNLLEFMKYRKINTKNDLEIDSKIYGLPLCIFGGAHYEGIRYYLLKNGYKIIGEPTTF